MITALVTGCSGQVGSYLCELLLAKGHTVVGMVPHRNFPDWSNLRDCLGHSRFKLVYGDMCDEASLQQVVQDARPDWVCNAAAQSFVQRSWELPLYTYNVTGIGAIRLMEAVKRTVPNARFIQCSTSEMFGQSPPPQCELTPFLPESPYAVAKLAAHQAVGYYRQAYGLHYSAIIMFNNESPRRTAHFVTQKIAKAAAEIQLGLSDSLQLGNINSRRDWGWTPDYVDAIWRMFLEEEPDDYVIGTGRSHSVRQFAELAFSIAGLDAERFITCDTPELLRPLDSPNLLANCGKAQKKLGWVPRTDFREIVTGMVAAQQQRLKAQETLSRAETLPIMAVGR